LATRKHADVVVVGAGIFGLSCAWSCVLRGLTVIVLERGHIACGASGGVVGAMSPHIPDSWNAKKQFQFEALVDAEAHWREIEKVSGLSSGYGRVGRLLPLVSEKAQILAESRAEDAHENWRGLAEWSLLASDAMPDWLAPETAPFGIVHETLSARIDPGAACAALAAALTQSGCEIQEDWPVENVGQGSASGPGGSVSADAVILAEGVAGFKRIGPEAGSGEKGQAAVFALPELHDQTPTIFHDGLYVVPQTGGRIAVGSTSERVWTEEKTDQLLDALILRARQICPSLSSAELVQRWSGVRPRPRKRDPMLGPLPGYDQVFVANGAFKIGFGIAHKVGAVLADMVMGMPTDLPESFSIGHHLTD
jgi:glycine oxidase